MSGSFFRTPWVPRTRGIAMAPKIPVLFVVVGMALSGTPEPAAAQVEAEYLQSETTRVMGLPFSDAVRVGDILFLSGQLGNRPGEMEVVPGGIQAETRQTMENIKATLQRHDLDMGDIIKCTVFLADMSQWPEFNKVYASYFEKGRYPARSALAAAALALGARVEVECIAALPTAG